MREDEFKQQWEEAGKVVEANTARRSRRHKAAKAIGDVWGGTQLQQWVK